MLKSNTRVLSAVSGSPVISKIVRNETLRGHFQLVKPAPVLTNQAHCQQSSHLTLLFTVQLLN